MGQINITQIFNAEEISASGSATSTTIPYQIVTGYSSLQVAVTGSGTCKFEALVSLDGSNFVDSTEVSDLLSSFTATSGNGSDGKDVVSINIPPCKAIKIKCTETGGANSVTVTAYIGIQ